MNFNTVGLITNALSKEIALNQRTAIWEGRALSKVSRRVTQIHRTASTKWNEFTFVRTGKQIKLTLERSKQRPKQGGSCHGGEFGFYSKCNQRPLQTFKQWDSACYFQVLKRSLWVFSKEYIGEDSSEVKILLEDSTASTKLKMVAWSWIIKVVM